MYDYAKKSKQTSVRFRPLEYLQVQMTDLGSLFIAMIPIDFKITNLSLHLFVYFFLYQL